MSGEADEFSTMPIWRTVTIGMYPSTAHYLHMLSGKRLSYVFFKEGYVLEKEQRKALQQIPVSPERAELDLVAIPLPFFRFNKNLPHFTDLCERAIAGGLELAPPEVGAALRSQYLNQARGEWIDIPMQGVPRIGHTAYAQLYRSVEDSLCVIYTWIHPEGILSDQGLYVFVRPRRA